MAEVQTNTGNEGGSALFTPTGNTFIDALNSTLGAVSQGVGIYGDIVNTQTQREIDLLNAQASLRESSNINSVPPFDAGMFAETIKKSAFAIGVGMMVFAATVYVTSRR